VTDSSHAFEKTVEWRNSRKLNVYNDACDDAGVEDGSDEDCVICDENNHEILLSEALKLATCDD
jgi:hypothetical protein